MKIAWLHENLLHWNGGVKYILEVSRRLRQKCSLDIYVTKASVGNKRIFSQAGVGVKEFSNIASDNLRYWIFYPYYLWANTKKLKRLLAEYDVLISSYHSTNLIAANLNKRTIFILWEPNGWIYSRPFVSGLPTIKRYLVKLGRPVARLYDQNAVRKADRLVAIDKFNASRIQKIYGRLPEVIHEGVDSKLFRRKHEPALEAAYSNYKIILHSATYLNPIKGTRFLIQALPQIVSQVPNCRLLILNPHKDEKARAELMSLARSLNIASYIEFLPFIKEENLPYYYSLAKVVVQPSLYESTRLPLEEGAACETPGVSFSEGTAGEDIVHGKTGFVAPIGDTDALAQMIIELLQNPRLSKAMGKAGREMVKRLFSWDVNAEMMWKYIKELAEG